MHPMLTIAVKAAREAGRIINRASQDVGALKIQSKTFNDFVSEVDHAAEQAIIDTIRDAYPDHGFLGEESGKSNIEADNIWIIDPLDGTTNFLHSFPQYCVSIALQQKGVLTQAAIYDPVRNDLFTATKGRGAFLNDKRIRVTSRAKLQASLISTGFPFRDFTHLDTYLAMLKETERKRSRSRESHGAIDRSISSHNNITASTLESRRSNSSTISSKRSKTSLESEDNNGGTYICFVSVHC